MVEISEVDVGDAAALRGFHDVACAGVSAARPYALLESFETLSRLAGTPSSSYRRELLVARESGRVLGTAQLGLHLSENTHLADLEVVVAPDERRRGVGRALHDAAVRRGRADGRTTYLGAVFQLDDDTPGAGTAFARALGYDLVEEDHHVVRELPVAVERLHAVPVADGYEVLHWQDRTPDDLIDGYVALQTRMSHDLPSEGIDRDPSEVTVDEVREMEARAAQVGTRLVAAARHRDGLVGYSIVDLEHGSTDAAQLDTMVLPEHRGRGLGLSMKAAILRTVQHDHPDRRRVHSWNAVGNAPIRRLNDALGFRTVEVAWQVQRRDADA